MRNLITLTLALAGFAGTALAQLPPLPGPGPAPNVTSFQGRRGAVTLNLGDVAGVLLNGSVAAGHVPAFTGTSGQMQDGGTLVNSLAGNTGAVTQAQVAAALSGQSIAPTTVTTTTQALGNNSTQAATTAFVLGRGSSFGGFNTITTTTALTSAAFGQYYLLTPSVAITVTLPQGSSGFPGEAISFYNYSTAKQIVTLLPYTGDNISGKSSVIVPGGMGIRLTNVQNGGWRYENVYSNMPFAYAGLSGAVDDAVNFYSSGITVAASSNALKVLGASFVATDVGKTVVVAGAGAAVPAPATTVLTVNYQGGSLPNAPIYVKLTYVTPSGETAPSAEFSATLNNASSFVAVTRPIAADSATGYNVYAAATSGAEVLQNTSPVQIGKEYILKSLTTGTASAPSVSTAGYGTLVTTISSVTDSTDVVLTANASGALSAVAEGFTYGTDNAAAINACVTNGFASCVLRPTGGGDGYLIGSNITISANQELSGSTRPQSLGSNNGNVSARTPMLLMPPSATISVNGRLNGLSVFNAAEPLGCNTMWQCFLTSVASFSGVAIILTGSASIRDVNIAMFAVGIDNKSYNDFDVDHALMGDTMNIVVDQFHDFGTFITNITSRLYAPEFSATSPAVFGVTGAANNGSGAIRLTISSTADFATGNTALVYDVGGVTAASGRWIVTVVDGTHLDLQGSTFSGTYTSGGNVLLRPFLAGPAYAFTIGEGVQATNLVSFGYDHCVYLGTDAGWVNASYSCDSFNEPDPNTIGTDLEGSPYSATLRLNYESSMMFPLVADAAIDSNTGGANGSPNYIIGGSFYTTAGTISTADPAYATTPTIKILVGTTVLKGALAGNIIQVASGATLALSGCANFVVGSGTNVPGAAWAADSDLTLVTQDGTCPVAAPASGTVTNAPFQFVASPSGGSTFTAAINGTGVLLQNSTALATYTIKLPAITGDYNQTFSLASTGGVTALTVQTSTGGGVSNSPTALAAGGVARGMRSTGTTWATVQ